MAVTICPTCNPPGWGLNPGPVPAGFKRRKKQYKDRKGKTHTVYVLEECKDCQGFGIISDHGQPPQ